MQVLCPKIAHNLTKCQSKFVKLYFSFVQNMSTDPCFYFVKLVKFGTVVVKKTNLGIFIHIPQNIIVKRKDNCFSLVISGLISSDFIIFN